MGWRLEISRRQMRVQIARPRRLARQSISYRFTKHRFPQAFASWDTTTPPERAYCVRDSPDADTTVRRGQWDRETLVARLERDAKRVALKGSMLFDAMR